MRPGSEGYGRSHAVITPQYVKDRLHILQIFASAGWGGGERYAYDLSCELVRNGHIVGIVSRRSEIISSKACESGIPHTSLPLKGLPDIVSAVRLARLIRMQQTDIVHVHNFKDAFTAVYANLLAGRRSRIVLTRHLVRKGKTSLPYCWLYKHLDRMVFVSALARDEFLSTASKQAAKTEVIYNSVAVGGQNPQCSRAPENLRERFGIEDDAFLIGFSGRIAPEKGLDTLIEAIGSIKQAKVAAVLIGGGDNDYIDSLKTLAKRQGVEGKVFFYGYADDVYGLITQVDAGTAPSIAREAFCLSAIEYMRAGKPVVTTHNGAQREYIRNAVNGLLVPPSDPAALADAIEALAKDDALRHRLSQEGKRTFEELFSYDTFYSRMVRVYSLPQPESD